MVKTLQRHGNSHALVLDKPILEMMGADEDTEFQLTIASGSLIVTPINVGVGRERLDQLFRQLEPRYGEMLRRLAK